ncbi:MAG: MFS transporter [Acidobacteriota bacterium]|nr:MFS transporter [Acidobacteriota bacterium]MDE3264648.1 MFS transporter [Acidobacteriota bacterium]
MTDDIQPQTADDPPGRRGPGRRRKVPLRTKLAFSSGGFQEGMVVAGRITTLIFYNQVLGVSAALCGVAYLVASIVDAVSDPMVGAISDRFRSRWGRRHPLMLMSALPIAISFYFLYQPISGLSEGALFAWQVCFLVLLRISTSFHNIPRDALGAELTDDYHERTSVFGWYNVVATGAAVGLSLLVLNAVFPSTPEFSNGLLDPNRYVILAGFGAVVVLAAVLVCTFGTADQIPHLHATTRRRFNFRDHYGELRQLLANRSFVSVTASWLTIAAAQGVLDMVNIFTWIWVYDLSTEQFSVLAFAKIPGIFVALPLAKYMTRRFDKKPTVIFTSAVAAVLVAFPHVLRLAGLFPGNDSALLLPLVFGPLFVGYALVTVMAIVVDSQLVDIADDHELRTGSRAEGTIFSVREFAMKATEGFGGLIGGFGLELIQFPQNAEAEGVSAGTLTGLLVMSGPLCLVIYGVGILFMMLYRLNAGRHEEILTVLEARRAARATGTGGG